MKISRVCFSATALFLLAGVAMACGDHPVMSATNADGVTIGLVIPRAAIEATPAWHPAQGEPPLQVSRAHDNMQAWAQTAYQQYDRVEVREIALSKYGCTRGAPRWYYRFELVPIFDGNEVWGAGNWAAVLMDGSVIGAGPVD